MSRAEVVRFSVRWEAGPRVVLVIATVFLAALTAGWVALVVGSWRAEPSAAWTIRSLLVFFLAVDVLFLRMLRLSIWLDRHRLVRQGALLRTSVDLRAATFSMRLTSWEYTRRFGPLRISRLRITAPTLVVRGSRPRRITLPLARRAAQPTPDGRFEARWLPATQLRALADAIDEHSTAANRDKVVRFLRNVHRSPIQPSLGFQAPM